MKNILYKLDQHNNHFIPPVILYVKTQNTHVELSNSHKYVF